MAVYIIPAVCSKGFISAVKISTNVAADKIFTAGHVNSLDEEVRAIGILADGANASPYYLGSSTVTIADGMPQSAGDILFANVTGQSADSWYDISTVGTDNIRTFQFG